MNLDEEILNNSNIYLAYLRVKNNVQNEELKFEQELIYFEKKLEENLIKIKEDIRRKEYEFQKFDFILKFKKIDEKNEYRPIVRFRFYDMVLMQAIFNVVANALRNFIPKENYGIQLTEENSPYFYKNWITQYKQFVNEQRKNLSEETIYQYCYEYDIQQFYPSIQQDNLINQLQNALDIDEDSLTIFWVKKIIKYYKFENVSKETIDLFNLYYNEQDKNDLGLPQGPLYSAFLSSFYTKDLFKNIKKNVKKDLNTDCEIFAYVDDGRIYFKDKVCESIEEDNGEKGIRDIVSEALLDLNDNSNDKNIKLNEDKSCLITIDEKSITNKLNYLMTESSLINNSINPVFEIEKDTIDAIKNRHDAIKASIQALYNELKNKENDPETKNQIRKLNKTYSTYVKRNASFLTRKISSNEEFYDFTDEIFCQYTKEKEGMYSNICDLNYYYSLVNMFKYTENDRDKQKYFCKKIQEMLNSYAELCDAKISMLYYYITTIKAAHTIKCTDILKSFVDNISKGIEDNVLIGKAKNSYYLDTWFQMYEDDKEDTSDINSDIEMESILYFKNKPYLLAKTINHLSTEYEIKYTNLSKDSDKNLVKKYSSYRNTDNNNNFDIFVVKTNYLFNGTRDDYFKFNSINLDAYRKIKILKYLVWYWIDELENKKYINPSFMQIDNIYIHKEEKKEGNKIYIVDNMSIFYSEYEIYKFGIPYKTYLSSFFKELFNCTENIIVNDKGRALKFWEYRILSYLENHGFILNEFLSMLSDLLQNYDYFNHDVDINYERIRKIVDNKLKTSADKDVIMQLHYFIQCIWKNGSKDLTFFTLHNQEHSVELIQNYLNISKKLMSKLSLTKNENFILFSACYLHDVGMLKGLTVKEKYDILNPNIIDYYMKALSNVNFDKTLKIENGLNKLYEISDLTNELMENIVRGEHAKRSSIEIQNDGNLPLSDLEKYYVAEVSENHYKDTNDVYGLNNKKVYRETKIDIRKISIWLRLLDLTDITKYRVTQEVFDRYFDRMGIVSKFHWVKHLCVDELNLKVEQKLSKEENDENLEKIILTIQVVMNYIPPKEKLNEKCSDSKKCKKFKCKNKRYNRLYKDSEKKGYCTLECAFLNEFMYFDQEIEAINNYARLYKEPVEFRLEYVLNEETLRSDFIILRKANKQKITATDCIRRYFTYKNS